MALTDGLVSYWKLNENAANTDVDDSHGASDGTASTNTNNLSVAGKISTAFEFNGSTEYVEFGDNAAFSIDNTSGLSFNFWAKSAVVGAGNRALSKGSANPNFEYEMYYTSNTVMCYIFTNAGGTIANYGSAGNIASDTGWRMVTVTMNDSLNELRVYINGTEVGNDTTWSAAAVGAAHPLEIGRRGTGYWAGIMDELGVWNRVLTPTEITSLYNGGSGLAYPFSTGTNCQVNIGDSWKAISAAQINIGDSWKAVEGMQINIGDVWKTIF